MPARSALIETTKASTKTPCRFDDCFGATRPYKEVYPKHISGSKDPYKQQLMEVVATSGVCARRSDEDRNFLHRNARLIDENPGRWGTSRKAVPKKAPL